jgi:hypothetical protein
MLRMRVSIAATLAGFGVMGKWEVRLEHQ